MNIRPPSGSPADGATPAGARSRRPSVVALHPTEALLRGVTTTVRRTMRRLPEALRFGKRGRGDTTSCGIPTSAPVARMRYEMPMLIAHEGSPPQVDPTAYVQASAQLIGDVHIGPEASVWFNVVLRGDGITSASARARNMQDNATIHVATGRHADARRRRRHDRPQRRAARLHRRQSLPGRHRRDRARPLRDRRRLHDRRRLAADAGHVDSRRATSCSAARRRSCGRSPTPNARTCVQSAHNYVANAARYRAQGI